MKLYFFSVQQLKRLQLSNVRGSHTGNLFFIVTVPNPFAFYTPANLMLISGASAVILLAKFRLSCTTY